MGYEIYTALRLEALIDGHLDEFQAGFFSKQPLVVVQNQSLAQWLKLHLAQALGGYATGEYLFQDEALRRLLEASGAAPGRLLFLDDLKFALYRRLEECLSGVVDPVFRPLAPQGRPDAARLFELADHIAGVFHNYAMNSALWPPALEAGHLPGDLGADPSAFGWQSRLWQELVTTEGDGATMAGLVLDRLTKEPPRPWGNRPRLILVGSAFLSRKAAAFLRAWAEAGLIDVVHLLLLPAPASGGSLGPDRRPWSSWGTFGRAFLELLPDSDTPSPVPPLAPKTALEVVQASLSQGVDLPPVVPDTSLEVLCCPHPLRELELLRDRLLAALDADPGLQVHQIAVLAPDINVYAPFLDAAFGSDDPGRRLAFHVIDLDLGKENAWFRALDALLSLVSGHIDRPNLFALVETEAFTQAWSVEPDEKELWLDFTDEVSAWREEGLAQSWTAGWERLFEGWFRPGEDGGPLDASPTAFRSLGRFHLLLTTLTQRAAESRVPRSFLGWIRFFDGLTAEFLGVGDGTAAVLSGRLRTLALDAGSPEFPLPWSGFRAFVQDQIAHFPGRRGQLLTEGLHCSSLRPLRAIPFRIIAILGLDEGRFPRQSGTPSFDLRRHEPGQAEVSALALDRYCFWETLMAAQSRLILSYQGRSAVDGTERPPSPVLADLLDYLETDRPWPVTQGTVKDFSVTDETTPTWSPRTHRRALALREAHPVRVPEAPSVEAPFPEVRSSEVVQAFVTPAKFHLRRVRQIVLRDEDRRGIDDEEPWSLDFFEVHGWLQEQLRRHLKGLGAAWDVGALLDQAVASGRVRHGVFADRDRRELERRSTQVKAWADGLLAQGWSRVDQPRARRTRWAGLPWAAEPDDRLVRPGQALVPRLLFAEKLPFRTKVEVAIRLVQEPSPRATLATLNPHGQAGVLTWTLDEAGTEALGRAAEAYWSEAAERPLALYPDFIEALAKRRADQSESWEESVDRSWRSARDPGFVRSESTLGRDPYAALAFPDDQPPASLAQDAAQWWDKLWKPLLEAWQ